MTDAPGPRTLSVQDLARRIDVGRDQIRAAAKRQPGAGVPALMVGGRCLILASWVDAFERGEHGFWSEQRSAVESARTAPFPTPYIVRKVG